MSNDDFFGGLKSKKDRDKEWADAAQFYVDIRRSGREESVDPLPEQEPEVMKVSSQLRAAGQAALGALRRIDPTGLSTSMSTKPGLIAGLIGGGIAAVGTGLASRGKKELEGKSQLEHDLEKSKKTRDKGEEPSGFMGKLQNNFADLSAGLASSARKHPVKASILGALGGAAIGNKVLNSFRGKV